MGRALDMISFGVWNGSEEFVSGYKLGLVIKYFTASDVSSNLP